MPDSEDRWEFFADSAEKEVSSNGDNVFVRYVGPWVVGDIKCDPEDGNIVEPSTPNEWIDEAISQDRREGDRLRKERKR